MKAQNNYELAIIGGGPAGIMSALSVPAHGSDVCIIEGNERIGKKLLMTGDGKCNLTNRTVRETNYHSSNKGFFRNALLQFSNEDTVKFFDKLGLAVKIENDGRMYPMSLQASSVLDVLRFALNERRVAVINNFKVKNIGKVESGFRIRDNNGKIIESRKLILACGGKAAPFTGSDGSGYDLAKSFGHRIIDPLPSLVQLKFDFAGLKGLAGVRFDGEAQIYINGEPSEKVLGEILFTRFGATGPAILKLSRIASVELKNGKDVKIRINLLPDLNGTNIEEILKNYSQSHGDRSINDLMIGLLNKRIIPVLLKDSGFENIHMPAEKTLAQNLQEIVKHLTGWEFRVSGTLSFKDAQVTAGGVDTRDVDPVTLESKIVKGLYFAGEILDVDGDSGGYNLQWAWSSGWVAGKIAGTSKNNIKF
jgi:predicted Rossmann fold flavoprotein